MIKIRLMRIGAKKRPFYRVVVVDEQAKRTGAYIELLGTYDPLTTPKDIKLKKDRIDYWIKQGAQPSTGYLRIIGKAPQRPPRKPKKEKKQVTPAIAPTAEAQAAPAEKVTPQPAETPKETENTTPTVEPAKEEVNPASDTSEPTKKESEKTSEGPA